MTEQGQKPELRLQGKYAAIHLEPNGDMCFLAGDEVLVRLRRDGCILVRDEEPVAAQDVVDGLRDFVASLLSGNAVQYMRAQKQGTEGGEDFPKGAKLRVSHGVVVYRGKDLVKTRVEWQDPESGEWRPTEIGISVRRPLFDRLTSVLLEGGLFAAMTEGEE